VRAAPHRPAPGVRRPGASLVVAVLAALCLVLTACGGDDPRPGGGEYAGDGAAPATCAGRDVSTAPADTPAGASTTALGDQPAAYELQAPASRPRGVVIVLHGGGWVDVGHGQIKELRREASQWLARGWATANLDYRPCEESLDDVLRMHDAIRERVGPDAPIVVVGESAGAQLALILAAKRQRSVGAVVAKAPPTDPVTLATQTATNPATGQADSPFPRELAEGWRAAFGDDWLETSPTRRVASIVARVLVARSQGDPIIPLGQITDFARALSRAHPGTWVRALDLPAGASWFPHAPISPEADATFRAAEAEAVQPWSTATPAELGVPAAVEGWWAFPEG